MVEVTLWNMHNLPSFKSSQYSPNEVEQRGLVQKNNNLMHYIFGRFEIMQWWEAKAREGYTPRPFEEVTDHSKSPLVLIANISQPKRNFENNMPSCTKKLKKSSTDYEYYKMKVNCV